MRVTTINDDGYYDDQYTNKCAHEAARDEKKLAECVGIKNLKWKNATWSCMKKVANQHWSVNHILPVNHILSVNRTMYEDKKVEGKNAHQPNIYFMSYIVSQLPECVELELVEKV